MKQHEFKKNLSFLLEKNCQKFYKLIIFQEKYHIDVKFKSLTNVRHKLCEIFILIMLNQIIVNLTNQFCQFKKLWEELKFFGFSLFIKCTRLVKNLLYGLTMNSYLFFLFFSIKQFKNHFEIKIIKSLKLENGQH